MRMRFLLVALCVAGSLIGGAVAELTVRAQSCSEDGGECRRGCQVIEDDCYGTPSTDDCVIENCQKQISACQNPCCNVKVCVPDWVECSLSWCPCVGIGC